jgi:hypothetical protein
MVAAIGRAVFSAISAVNGFLKQPEPVKYQSGFEEGRK